MKKPTKKIRVEVIRQDERRALRNTGRTSQVRMLARECDMAFGKFQAIREVELRVKADAYAAWNEAQRLIGKLADAVEREEIEAARRTRKGK